MSYRSQRSRPCRGVTKIDARPILVFVTVGTALRVPWLANDEVRSALRDIWFKADRWETGIYVIMPDHIHLFAWPGKIEHDLDAWIRYWKSLVTKHLGSSACSWQQCFFPPHNPVVRKRGGEARLHSAEPGSPGAGAET